MSGFLQRLATQAMGSTNSLRTMAHQPYASQPSPVHAEVRDKQIDTLGNPADAQHEADNRGAQPGLNALSSPPPEALVARSFPEIANNTDRTKARSSSAETMSRLHDANVAQTVAGKSPVLADEIEIHIPEDSSVTSSISHDKQILTQPDNGVPPHLLPLSNSARPSVLNAGAVATRGMSSDSSLQAYIEETTEVHVSIGRIEVTAVHEAPPPKRQAPSSAKPMSLDEYLARRKREA